jgi:D-lactate dehydrogenase
MNIVFYETEQWEQDYLKERLAGQSLEFKSISEVAGLSQTEIVCNFIGVKIDKETLTHFPRLKYVTTRSTGYDHIDLKACAERGILVSNVPTYGENTVAEFAFALILALSRKLYPAVKQVREQGLFATAGLQGFDLKGKTLGVVGSGHIGAHVIKIAKGFEMHVLAYDPHPNQDLARQLGFEYTGLDDLLKKSDIVSLHVPYMPATHHIINKEKFQLFKKGSILINTARGGLVDTESLVDALQSGQLAGAGLDVLEEEGFVKEEIHLLYKAHPNADQLKTVLADHELMQMDNVLITPHNAFNTRQALERILDTTIANIQSFIHGRPANIVKMQ